MRTTLAAAVLACCAGAAHSRPANDPSGGWLSYAKFTAKPTDTITRMSADMVVPDTPTKHGGYPAFWFGLQTEKGDGALVQPIMAKFLGRGFNMFEEIFDWTDESDEQTKPNPVKAGDVISASVQFVKADRSYNMNMTCLHCGKTSNYNYKLKAKQVATESVGYFVLEHQPQSCAELPPSGVVHWTNIQVEVNGQPVANPKWVAAEESPKCGAKVCAVQWHPTWPIGCQNPPHSVTP